VFDNEICKHQLHSMKQATSNNKNGNYESNVCISLGFFLLLFL